MRRRSPAASVRVVGVVMFGVAALALLAACSSSGTSSSATTSSVPTTAPAPSTTHASKPRTSTSTAPAPSSTSTAATATACQPAPTFTPGTTTHDITVDGLAREFLVHMPPHPTADMRLVVDFHGAGSDMQQQDLYSGFDPVADQNGFVVATPNGAEAAIRQWNFLSRADVDFAKQIVQTLVSDACVDPGHAYAVGISSGGAMTASLACQASDTFAGFGPVAADFYIPAICARARPRPIIIFHGTADPLVPYNGGHVGTASGLPVMPAEVSAADWARHNGCASGPTSTQLGSQVVRLTWNGCVAPVVMYKIVGGGHTWPGAALDVTRLGLTTHQVSATDEMWKFFAAN